MKKLFKWFLMLNKRLYKKPSFIAILLIIPIAIFSLGLVSELESGFLTILLSETNKDDDISSEIIEKLLSKQSLLHFVYVDDPLKATDMVRNGSADAAWIFSEGLKEKIDEFTVYGETDEPIVTVIEREQTVLLRLAAEKLAFALQHYSTKAYYVNFARANSEVLNSLSDEELIAYFDNSEYSTNLFVYDTAGKHSDSAAKANYVTAPVRGLLAVVVMLSGLAAILFFMQDKANGTFSWVAENRRIYVAFGCILITILNVGAVVLLALALAGLSACIWLDIIYMLLYAVVTASFSLLLLELVSSIRLLASIIPALVTLSIVVCPVFYDYRAIRPLQHLFPPTLFINAAYEKSYITYMLIYTSVCLGLSFIIERIKKSNKRIKSQNSENI